MMWVSLAVLDGWPNERLAETILHG